LKLKIVERGVVFQFCHSNGETSDVLPVEQSWRSVHSLLSRLRKNQTYCAKDLPLLIWKEGEELHIKFYYPESQEVEECAFSGEETKGILTMLAKLPSMN
jgi:hypothetical protein